MNVFLKTICMSVAMGFCTMAVAQDRAGGQKISTDEKISILEEEIEALKLKKATKTYQSVGGMGPAASAVYGAVDGLSIGGYAEIVATKNKSKYKKSIADAERLILYTGYHFSDKIIFNSEIEFEHAGFERAHVVSDVDFASRDVKKETVASTETYVEFAYLDFILHKAFQVRAGLNLVPIGITNYMHEPTTFYSVYRPETETSIIPSTWRELGVFAHGEFVDGKVMYKTGIMSGLDGSNFSEEKWIKDGRYKGSQAELKDLAYIINIDTKPFKNLLLGGTYYMGGAGQGNVPLVRDQNRAILPANPLTDQALDDFTTIQTANQPKAKVTVNLAEGHFIYQDKMFDFRGLFVRGWMNEEDSRSLNSTTGENVGRVAEGGYLQAGVNILAFTKSSKKLMLFVRDERINTQRDTNERYAGGKEDMIDAVCSNSTSCKTTDLLTNGDRDLGVIASNDPGKEVYGVKGTANRTNDRSIVTLGMAYYPHPNVVLKLEYARRNSKTSYYRDSDVFNANNNKGDQINFGAGLIF